MPDADGFALLRHIREIRRLDVPVIAMTAFGHTTDRDRILAAGFSGYLTKPVEPIDLAEKLHGILATRAAKIAAYAFPLPDSRSDIHPVRYSSFISRARAIASTLPPTASLA